MTIFPDTIHFTGLNTPVRTEVSIRNLPVIGALPRRFAVPSSVPCPTRRTRRCTTTTSSCRATA